MKRDPFLCLAGLAMDTNIAVSSFAVPLFAIRLGASAGQLGLIGAMWSLFYALFCPFSGRLSDRIGRGGMLILSCLCSTGVYIALSFSWSVHTILPLSALAGMSASMFWPSVLAWLAEGKERAALARVLGTFNVSWSIGLLLGPLIGGFLYGTNPLFPFYFSATSILLLGAMVYFTTPEEGNSLEEVDQGGIPDTSSDTRRRYLHAAWTANFATFFTIGVARNLFPKLAVELKISPETLGWLLAFIALAQMLVFLLMRRTNRWPYRPGPLFTAQALGLLGTLLIYRYSSTSAFALAFLFLGIVVGMGYYSSVFYSLFQQARRGAKSGIHESIIGSGFFFGPLTGGFLAERFGLRAPYLLCATLLLCGMLIEVYLLRGRRAESAPSLPSQRGVNVTVREGRRCGD